MAKRFKKVSSYEDWTEPKLVSNTLEILDREIPRLRDKIESVQLCFTTDPFMSGYDEIEEMSLAAIRKLNEAGIKCVVLTKGLLPITLAEQLPDNQYGITLVSLSEDYRERFEPGAAPYAERLAALQALAERGCHTWVSVEPYPTPNIIEQDIRQVLEAIRFTDRIVFGRTNYSKEISAFRTHKTFYNEQAAIVTQFCIENGIDYYIKNGTITEPDNN
jgi:DNA repair photolyase